MGKISEQERTQLAEIIEASGLYRLKSLEEFDAYLDHCMDGFAKGIESALPLIGGVSAAKRILKYITSVGNMKSRITNHNDWYLYNYECVPEFDNDEMFTKMLEPAVNYAWSTGRTCYVESSVESRMSSYMKMGFHIVDEITVPNSNVKIYGVMV